MAENSFFFIKITSFETQTKSFQRLLHSSSISVPTFHDWAVIHRFWCTFGSSRSSGWHKESRLLLPSLFSFWLLCFNFYQSVINYSERSCFSGYFKPTYLMLLHSSGIGISYCWRRNQFQGQWYCEASAKCHTYFKRINYLLLLVCSLVRIFQILGLWLKQRSFQVTSSSSLWR